MNEELLDFLGRLKPKSLAAVVLREHLADALALADALSVKGILFLILHEADPIEREPEGTKQCLATVDGAILVGDPGDAWFERRHAQLSSQLSTANVIAVAVPSNVSDDMAAEMLFRQFERGARKAVGRCLLLSRGEELVTVADVDFAPTANLLMRAAASLQVPATTIIVPEQSIGHATSGGQLAEPIAAAIQHCNALAIVTNRERVPFRTCVLRYAADIKHISVGTMPSVGVDFFRSGIDADYEEIETLADQLMPTLILGSDVLVETWDSDNRRHSVRFQMDGIRDVPFRSTGIILRGKSGNIPSGECFGNVQPGTISGSFVCDGSFPGIVIRSKLDELILHYRDGAVFDVESKNASNRDALLERITENKNCVPMIFRPHHNLPCEFGLGINRSIVTLMGVPINDEKMYGTVHIALGTNTHFWQGGITATQHIDMVSLRPRVTIDGRCILEDREFTAELARFVEGKIEKVSAKLAKSTGNELLRLSGKYEWKATETLTTYVTAWNGRREEMTLPTASDSQAYREVLSQLHLRPQSVHELVESTRVSLRRLNSVLCTLMAHGLVS